MRKLYLVRVFLAVATLLISTNFLSAQVPIATTVDGKVVLLQSEVEKLPQERQRVLQEKENVIVVSSRSELDGMLKDGKIQGYETLSDNPEGKVENDRKTPIQLYEQGTISKSEYEKLKKEEEPVSTDLDAQGGGADHGGSAIKENQGVKYSADEQRTVGDDKNAGRTISPSDGEYNGSDPNSEPVSTKNLTKEEKRKMLKKQGLSEDEIQQQLNTEYQDK